MTIPAIPTLYNGVQYRSRLEARWANFFDLLGWDFQYEPFDLNGWIPDFLLTKGRVLVEVKPTERFPVDIAEEIMRSGMPPEYEAMIVGCTLPGEKAVPYYKPNRLPLVVGGDNGVPIGWMRANPASWRQGCNLPESDRWGMAMVQEFEIETVGPDPIDDGIGLYCSSDHIMRCDPGYTPEPYEVWTFAKNRVGNFTGKFVSWGVFMPAVRELGVKGENKVLDLWNQAGNLTQWRGKQSVTDARGR